MQRTFKLTGFCFILLLLIWCPAAPAGEKAVVKWVIDGDTVVLTDGRKVRYIGINAPEVSHKTADGKKTSAEPFGEAAKAFNSSIVDQKEVQLVFDRERKDRYKRLLAYVFLENGDFVNQKMNEAGLACCLPIPPNTRFAEKLLAAQRQAMNAGKGMWKAWKEKEGNYIGNRRSMRFHAASCSLGRKTSSGNRVSFQRRWDAYYSGYAPCKRCLGGGVHR